MSMGTPIIRGLSEIQRQGVIRYNRPIWIQNGGHDRPNPSHVFWLSMRLRLKQCSPCHVSVGPNSV